MMVMIMTMMIMTLMTLILEILTYYIRWPVARQSLLVMALSDSMRYISPPLGLYGMALILGISSERKIVMVSDLCNFVCRPYSMGWYGRLSAIFQSSNRNKSMTHIPRDNVNILRESLNSLFNFSGNMGIYWSSTTLLFRPALGIIEECSWLLELVIMVNSSTSHF